MACDGDALDVELVDGFGDCFEASGLDCSPALDEAGVATRAGDGLVHFGESLGVGVQVLVVGVRLGAAEDDVQGALHRVVQQQRLHGGILVG